EAACEDIRFDGEAITIRPTRRARGQILWLAAIWVLCGLLVIMFAVSGVWFGAIFFSLGLIFCGATWWRMARVRMRLDRKGFFNRNMWSSAQLRGADLAALSTEQRRRSSLWTYGLDARWPFSWSAIVVGVLSTSDGRVMRPEALRSDDDG